MIQALVRFLIGGVVVSAFAVAGDLFKPKSFAGLFGAAPSVALATLTLTILEQGKNYAGAESRSMIAGAAALFAYCVSVAWLLMRCRLTAMKAALSSLIVWLMTAFGLWFVFLK